MANLFISYSRTDTDFAKNLVERLTARGNDCWIDWDDIHPGDEFGVKVEDAILYAEVFIFLISKTSVIESKYCIKEFKFAEENNKRIIPVIIEDIDLNSIPSYISKYDYLDFRDPEYFDKVISAIEVNYQRLELLSRINYRQNRWKNNHRKNGYLIKGEELEEAQNLVINEGEFITDKKNENALNLLPVVKEFIFESQKNQAREVRRLRYLAIGISVFLFFAIAASIFAGVKNFEAVKNLNIANTSEVRAFEEAEYAQTQEALALEQKQIVEEQNVQLKSKQLAAESLLIPNSDYDLALLLSVASYSMDNNSDSLNALYHNLQRENVVEKILYFETEARSHIAVSDDSSLLVVTACLKTYEEVTYNIDICESTEINILDSRTYQPVYSPFVLDYYIVPIMISPKNNYLAIGALAKDEKLGRVFVYDLNDLSEPIQIINHNSKSLLFTNDEEFIITGGYDGTIKFWDLKSGQMSKNLFAHSDQISDMELSSDGYTLISADPYDIVIWDLENNTHKSVSGSFHIGNITNELSEPDLNFIDLLFINEDTFISVGCDKTILWDLSSGQSIKTLDESVDTAISTDARLANSYYNYYWGSMNKIGENIFTFFNRESLIVYDIASDNILNEYELLPLQELPQVIVSKNQKIYLMSSEGKLYIYDINADKLSDNIWSSDSDVFITYNQDSERLAAVSGKLLYIWDTLSKTVITEYQFPISVKDVEWNNSGEILSLVNTKGGIWIYDFVTGQYSELISESTYFKSLFSFDSKTIFALSSEDNLLVAYDINTSEILWEISFDDSLITTGMTISPDGQRLVISHADEGQLGGYVLDIKNNPIDKKNLTIPFSDYSLNLCLPPVISDDSGYIAVGCGNIVHVWDYSSLTYKGGIKVSNQIARIQFADASSKLLVATQVSLPSYDDSSLIFYDVNSLEFIADLKMNHTDNLSDMIFNDKTWEVYTSSYDNSLIVYDLLPMNFIKRSCSIANRNLTQNEIETYFNDFSYDLSLCSDLDVTFTSPVKEYESISSITPVSLSELPAMSPIKFDADNISESITIDPLFVRCRESKYSDQLINQFLLYLFLTSDSPHLLILPAADSERSIQLNAGFEEQIEYELASVSGTNENGSTILFIPNQNLDAKPIGYSASELIPEEIIIYPLVDINEYKFPSEDYPFEDISEAVDGLIPLASELISYHTFGSEKYPQYYVKMEVNNLSEESINAALFGVVLNSSGEAIDLLFRDTAIYQLEPEGSGYVTAISLSQSGRCVGETNSEEKIYFRYFLITYTDDGSVITGFSDTIELSVNP